MTTLIYSPGVSIVIETARFGPINISDDITEGSLTLRENGSHMVNFTISNPYRKYDGVFAPNDRIVMQLKRIKWMQVFAGYLGTVPYFTTYPSSISLSAECSLKVLKNFPWDSKTQEAYALIHGNRSTSSDDGGVSEIIVKLLRDVAHWPEERIHIGKIPTNWYTKFEAIYQAVEEAAVAGDSLIGVNPILAGKAVGGFPATNPATSTGSSTLSLGATTAELIQIRDQDIPVALATIRQVESGNDYRSINKGVNTDNWATGAYQFLNSTWNGYGGYNSAHLAPPPVQDAKATEMVRQILGTRGRAAVNIPYSWYWPAVFNDPTWLDKVPVPTQNNSLTLRQYGTKWVGQYVTQFQIVNGGSEPPQARPNAADSQTSTSGSNPYPIPAGINQLDFAQVGWGGYSNGAIPKSAMTYSPVTHYGHPLAVKSWVELATAAATAGFDVSGYIYRDLAGQEQLKNSSGVKVPGTSNHGWGLAIDVTSLVGGPAKYNDPAYLWLTANAATYGWGPPQWATLAGKNAALHEPWHWEFFAIYSFKDGSFNSTGTQTSSPFDPNGAMAPLNASAQLFGALAWWAGDPEQEIDAPILSGYKALMNDTPIMNEIKALVEITGRSYCSAPNGDFISWFPDYWGEFGIAGRMDIETIELKNFSVAWSDDGLITHQYVIGAMQPGFGPLPGGLASALAEYTTRGVITVDMPGVLRAVLSGGDKDFPWMSDPQLLLQRFGARMNTKNMSTINSPQAEFWFAVKEFTKAWASQFTVNPIPMTFMPELFPGMLLRIPEYGVQFYVAEVSHSFNLGDGGEFTTNVTAMAPSAIDGSGKFFLFPKSGQFNSGTGGGGGGILRTL